jgi:hypothetical protein
VTAESKALRGEPGRRRGPAVRSGDPALSASALFALALCCVSSLTDCQDVNTAAASGGLRPSPAPLTRPVAPTTARDAGAEVVAEDGPDSGCVVPFELDPLGIIICGDPITGEPPVVTETPPIQTRDGSTDDPCVQTTQQAYRIRETFCSSCHAPPASFGGFNFILDDAKLVDPAVGISNKTRDDAGKLVRLVIPGDPDNSWIYQRVQHTRAAPRGQMPPLNTDPTLPQNPRPTVSDISVLREWIENCARP